MKRDSNEALLSNWIQTNVHDAYGHCQGVLVRKTMQNPFGMDFGPPQMVKAAATECPDKSISPEKRFADAKIRPRSAPTRPYQHSLDALVETQLSTSRTY